jgi:hypothetical protein
MAFFNWGQESTEQKKHRSFIEEQALLEQAINAARSGNAPGVGGGSLVNNLNTLTTEQTALVVFYELNVANYQYYIANYDSGAITGPFDTGVATADYSMDNLTTATIQYGGYALRFYRGDIDENKIIFMNSNGMVVDTITAISTDVILSSLSGRFITVTDADAALLWVFDGETVYVDDSALSGITGFNFNVAYLAGVGLSTYTTGLIGSAYKYYICNSTGVTKIYETAEQANTVEFLTYFNANKVIVKTLEAITNILIKVEVVSLTGTIEDSIVIDPLAYTNHNLNFYGNGSWFLHLRNIGDATVAHQIFNYDATTNTLNDTSVDAEIYTDFEYKYRSRNLSNNYNYPVVNNAAIVFHDAESANTNGFLHLDYCRIVNFFAGELPDYFDFTTDETKKIYLDDEGVNKNFFLYAVDYDNDGAISSMVIKAGTAPIFTSLGNTIVDLSDIDIHEVGERMDMIVEYSSGEPVTLDTYVYTYSATGLKLPGRLELDGENHSYYSEYNTYIVEGDGHHNFINSTTGAWSQYQLYDTVPSTGFFSQADQTAAPYILTYIDNAVPYTHTQLGQENDGELPEAFIMDGAVTAGTQYFGSGSSYFTNLYPGLFVLVAKSIDISGFAINGGLGVDGSGDYGTDILSIPGYSKTYSAYIKTVGGTGDPSVNHIIIIDKDDIGVDHTFDETNENDDHAITGISGATEIHYLLFAKDDGVMATNLEILSVIEEYLDLVDGANIATTLSTLNLNYSNITGVFPAYDSEEPGKIYYFSDYGSGSSNRISDGGNDMYDTGNIIITSASAPYPIRVFNGSGSVNSYSIPRFDALDLGKSRMIAQSYSLTEDIIARHYSIQGSLLNTVSIPQPDINFSAYVEDRGLVIAQDKIFDGDIYYNTRLYSFSPVGVDYVEVNLPDGNNQRLVFNDWAWFND